MGVDHRGQVLPEFGAGGGLSPQILSCCKILSTRLLALQCRKMFFASAMRPPRIPVRSTPGLKVAIDVNFRTFSGIKFQA